MRTIDKQFEALWDEFGFELGNFIKSKVSQVQDAEDILQEVFIKIFKNIDQLEKQSALKSWIYKITRNTIIDYYKRKGICQLRLKPCTLLKMKWKKRTI